MQLPEFRNEPLSDFQGNAAHREGMEQALGVVRRELGLEYEVVIGGQRIKRAEKFASTNPANPGQTVGVFSKANQELAERAIEAADKAFARWSRTSAETRVKLLVDVASILRDHKFYYAAWMVFEVGKTWPEADADVAEAIDFCEFYAREMLRYANPQPLTPAPDEKNDLRYIPLGVGIVIPPWNFPLAITVGMTTASIVTGNTVVLKPSSDSPTIAYKFFEALERAGMPGGVANFLPGPGGAVGDTLVTHPRTRYVAFTGSKAVGLRINELAAQHSPGQIWIKRVIAEMGGKDSILVDSDSDVDAAVEGVAVSSFGYQGQKCSACSRAIVVENIYQEFLTKLASRVGRMTLGDPANSESYLGPVINAKAEKQILGYIDEGAKEGRLVAGGKATGPGHFIQPTVIADVAPTAKIAQEEIFGPVLAVIKVKDFDEGLEVANNTEYGLTGAVYTNDPEKIERAAREFHVGNLYFNRKCTGAMVGAHPFGGFNMSGTDSKAGGRDYLLLFMQAKSVSKRIGKGGQAGHEGLGD
ncbi:MAG TPA: L-glutamate gamma-semialdehyde dehydrogenase [Terriglobia bacterium]|nr:L-glutamate gamma-semialdehyde dehydrogenase [Terriglobia bacterium]